MSFGGGTGGGSPPNRDEAAERAERLARARRERRRGFAATIGTSPSANPPTGSGSSTGRSIGVRQILGGR